MHVFIAFLIGIAIFARSHPFVDRADGEVVLNLGNERPVTVREQVKPLSVLQEEGVVRQKFDYSCGSAALAILLRSRFGEDVSEKQIIQGLLQYGDAQRIAERRAFSLLDMKKFVEMLGYKGAGYRAGIDDLQTLKEPGIIPIKIFDYRHFAVFKGITGNHVVLADPWRGNVTFSLSEFSAMWYENVIFMVHPQEPAAVGGIPLREQDLRFIDEDAARRFLFGNPKLAPQASLNMLEEKPGIFEYYRP